MKTILKAILLTVSLSVSAQLPQNIDGASRNAIQRYLDLNYVTLVGNNTFTGNNSFTGNNTWSGNNTFTGNLVVSNITYNVQQLTYATTTLIDLSLASRKTLWVTNNTTFIVTNAVPGSRVTVNIFAGTTNYTLTWSGAISNSFLNAVRPSILYSNSLSSLVIDCDVHPGTGTTNLFSGWGTTP